MFSPRDYELIDFGGGRKLERFGNFLLDRPCPAATGLCHHGRKSWSDADARYDRIAPNGNGTWQSESQLPAHWSVQHREVQFQLRCTEFGHVGLFPEQAENWDWISRRVQSSQKHLRLLNLFAYTGGSTLAAALAGAEIVHVDSSRSVVNWARRNAELSHLASAPIRWIVEDAVKFVHRELRRKNRYDGIVLDPPSYGHGSKGETWKIDHDLTGLLRACAELTDNCPDFFMLTCHSTGYGPKSLSSLFGQLDLDNQAGNLYASNLILRSASGHELPSGTVIRWSRSDDSQSV